MATPRQLTWSDRQIETLYPGCFAFVMASGIIANALLAENFAAWLATFTALALASWRNLRELDWPDGAAQAR